MTKAAAERICTLRREVAQTYTRPVPREPEPPTPRIVPESALHVPQPERRLYHEAQWRGPGAEHAANRTEASWRYDLRKAAAERLGVADVPYWIALRCVHDWPRMREDWEQRWGGGSAVR